MSRIGRRSAAGVLVALVLLLAAGPAAARQEAQRLEVVLAIDASESMEPAIDDARQAAIAFVDAMPEGVRIGIVTFADSVEVLTPPTTDRELIEQRIESITTGGDTALFDAVVTAAPLLDPSIENRVVVLLSDGKDEGSSSNLDEALTATEGLRVEAISLTTLLTDNEILRAFGTVTSADDAEAMSRAFSSIANLLVEVAETPPTTTPTPSSTTTTTTSTTTTSTPPTTAAVAPVPTEPPELSQVVVAPDEDAATLLWIGAGALFLSLSVFVLLLVVPRVHVSKARLGIRQPRNVSEIGMRTTSAIDEMLVRHHKRDELSSALSQADIDSTPAQFVAVTALMSFIVGTVGLVVGGPILAIVFAALVAYGTRLYVQRSAATRRRRFAEQLPDVLQLVTTALRSGYGITQALESVAEEAAEPARSEFAQVLAQTRMGRDLSQGLHTLARRMDSRDLEWVVSAIDINRETGGNLSEILHQVGVTIRERAQMARQVQTLTAEGRLSARILTATPFLMLLWQRWSNPDNFALLTHGIGLVALCVAGILMVLGAVWINRTVNSVAL